MAWYLDTPINYYSTSHLSTVSITNEYQDVDHLHVGNGNALDITHVDKTSFSSPSGPFHLNHTLYIPDIIKSLLSV